MTIALQALIQQARTELGSDACRAGLHQWESEGGRSCPHDLDYNCSQAVYLCRVCGAHDYSEPGGPGDTDCAQNCHHKAERAAAFQLTRTDPFDLAGTSAPRSPRLYHRLLLRAMRRQPKPKLP